MCNKRLINTAVGFFNSRIMADLFSVKLSYLKELIFQVSVPSGEKLVKRRVHRTRISVILCRKNGIVKHGVKFCEQDTRIFKIICAISSDYCLSVSCNIRQ